MKHTKRIVSLLLSVMITAAVFTALPFTANAAQTESERVGAAIEFTRNPEDCYISVITKNNTDVKSYPTLTVDVKGGSGSYFFRWCYKVSRTSVTSSMVASGSAQTSYQATKAGFYYCEVCDLNDTQTFYKSSEAEVTETGKMPMARWQIHDNRLQWGATDNEQAIGTVFYNLHAYYRPNDYFTNLTVRINRTSATSFTYKVIVGTTDYTSCYPVQYDSATRTYTMDLDYWTQRGNENTQYYYLMQVSNGYYASSDPTPLAGPYKNVDLRSKQNPASVTKGDVQIMNTGYHAGSKLVANLNGGIWSGKANQLNFRWVSAGGTVLQDSSSNTYTAKVADIGKRVSVYAYPRTTTQNAGKPYWSNDLFLSSDVSITKEQVEVKGPYYATFTEPVGGMPVNFNVTLTNNNDCKLNPATTSGTGLTYMNLTTGQPVNTGETFKKGNTYRAYVDLIIKKTDPQYEYIFTEDTKVYLNSKSAAVKMKVSKSVMEAYLDFTVTSEINTVKSVDLTLTEPKANAKPDFTVSKNTAACNFYVGLGILSPNGTGLEFIDHSKGAPTDSPFTDIASYMTKVDTFKAGQKYTARVFLQITNNDTYFATNFSATVNGKTAQVSNTSGGKETLIWVDYTFTVPSGSGGALVGDVNGDGVVNGADSGVLARYTAGWKGYADKIKNMDAADINRDGKVNGADAGLLSRYTAGWKGYDKYIINI